MADRTRVPRIGLGCVALLIAGPARADSADLAVWAGIDPGALSADQTRRLESMLIDELRGYESFRLVDAAGQPIDERLLTEVASLATRLKNEGVDLFLNFRHGEALERFDKAVAVFETRLAAFHDFEILHDTLLAKAEAHFQGRDSRAATVTLERLAALEPRIQPTPRTHPVPFVRLWRRAAENLGSPGAVRATSDPPGAEIRIDGRPRGHAPVRVPRLRPGKHYVAARWPHAAVAREIQVSPGKAIDVRLSREGPSEDAREHLLAALGDDPAAAAEAARQLASLAQASNVLSAKVLGGARPGRLVVARHDATGALRAAAALILPDDLEEAPTIASLRRAGALLFVDAREGEYEILEDGSALERAVLGPRQPEGEAPTPESPTERAVPAIVPSPPSEPTRALPEPPAETAAPLAEAWWFWTILGGAAIAGGLVAGAILLESDPDTTTFRVRVP